VKSDDVVGRVKTYEAIVKGENIPEPGVPESFKVLVKEMQSIGLDISVLDEDGDEIDLDDEEDDGNYQDIAKDLDVDIQGEVPDTTGNEGEGGAPEGTEGDEGDEAEPEPGFDVIADIGNMSLPDDDDSKDDLK